MSLGLRHQESTDHNANNISDSAPQSSQQSDAPLFAAEELPTCRSGRCKSIHTAPVADDCDIPRLLAELVYAPGCGVSLGAGVFVRRPATGRDPPRCLRRPCRIRGSDLLSITTSPAGILNTSTCLLSQGARPPLKLTVQSSERPVGDCPPTEPDQVGSDSQITLRKWCHSVCRRSSYCYVSTSVVRKS